MTTTPLPRFKKDDPLYHLLRDGKIVEFNQQNDRNLKNDLTGCDFRDVDLRGLDATDLDLSDCYFHQTDLRGIDFRQTKMEGASISNAKISGTYFPKELSALEIELSLVYGIRMRYSK